MQSSNMDFESDESERWEDFFGSSTDLTPSLISFYDKLTCNNFHEDRNGNVDASSAVAEESSCCNHTKQATSIEEGEEEVAVVAASGNGAVTSKVQSVNHNQTTANGVSAKHCNFRILSPNVQRLISNSTPVDRIDNGHVQYHNVNNGCLTKPSKRVVAKQKLSHIPLSKNTCKLTQAGSELVETFDSSLSSSESLDNLQTPTNKPHTNGATTLDNDKTPTNLQSETFRFDSDSKSQSNHSESDRSLDKLRKPDLIEDIHQAEADRISEIIQRFHQMYTSTLIDKDDSLKDSMDSLLENNIREIRGSNDKTTYETYNFLVRQPSINENSSVDKANNYLNKIDSMNETMPEAAKTPPESPTQPHKKLSPSSSPLLTYSRTKKLGNKPSLHGQKNNRKHSPPMSGAENELDTVAEVKPASPNNNRPNPLLDMAKGRHRPLSSSSICSTLSNSSSGSDNNHGGKMPVSYLASVESLADQSENENAERRGSSLTILKRSCMEIIDSEKSYVKDLFQIIDGYLIQWKDDASLKDDDLNILFSNIQEIHSFNVDLLDQLLEAGIDPVKIAKCFINLKDRFNVYTTYCTSYPEAIALLTSLLKASHTNTLLRLTQKNLKHTLPLGSYLLKPVQRILKYHLLLDNLRKHCDNKEIAQAHALMRAVAWNIDQVKKKLEQKSRVKEVKNILDGWLGPDLTVLGELKQEGILLENNKPRQVFLFQTMLILTKPKEDDRLQFKQYIHRKNLMLREHLPGEPTSFNVIPFDEPRNQIKLTSKNRDQKREWTQNIKDVMLEQFDIPSRAKELVYKLGDEEDRTPDKNIWKWGSNSTTPVYLERRNQYRRSEMRNRSKMKRKTITNSTSLDGFSAGKEYTNTVSRKQSMDDTMMPSIAKFADPTFIAPPKLKPGRCNHSSDVCRCSLIRQEFETLAEQNNMKERSKSVPKISGTAESDDESPQQSLENLPRKASDSSALYKFSTLGRSKSAKVADVKVYTTKSVPKRIATLKKNKTRKETSKFYMDLSDFDDTVLKITESTENLKHDKAHNGNGQKDLEESSHDAEPAQLQVELTEEEKNERAMTKDKLKRDAEIISELLKVSLNRISKKPPKKRSFDNTSTQSSTNLGHNNVETEDLPPPLPSQSPPPLDLDDETERYAKQPEDHIYEALRRNVHVPYKFSPVLNRSKSQQYYSSPTKVEKKSRSLPRPESDYVTLVYNESGDLKDVGETPANITSGNEVLRNSDSNINYESMSKKTDQSSPTSSSQCFSSIGDLQAQKAITNRSSKNLLHRFISIRGEHHVSTSESSLLPRASKVVENAVITRGNKPPERRVSDVTEMCRQSIIHRQGSDAVGERMANLDYVDPRTLFVSSANNSTVSLDPQRDSVFSLTSSNDSVSENNKISSPIIEEATPTSAATLSLSEESAYFDYEKNVEACLENDFRDSAVYSDDNEQRRQDCDPSEFSDFQLSPPPLPKRRVGEGNSGKRSSSNGKSKRGVPPPIPAKPQFVAPKRLSGASYNSDPKSPESCSPPIVDGKSWVLKQIENFNK